MAVESSKNSINSKQEIHDEYNLQPAWKQTDFIGRIFDL